MVEVLETVGEGQGLNRYVKLSFRENINPQVGRSLGRRFLSSAQGKWKGHAGFALHNYWVDVAGEVGTMGTL